MGYNDQHSNNNNNGGLTGMELPAIVLLLGAASWYKYGERIQWWLFDHMTSLALGGISLLILVGYFLYWRMRQKDEEEIQRLRRLSDATAPTREINTYYKRRDRDE